MNNDLFQILEIDQDQKSIMFVYGQDGENIRLKYPFMIDIVIDVDQKLNSSDMRDATEYCKRVGRELAKENGWTRSTAKSGTKKSTKKKQPAKKRKTLKKDFCDDVILKTVSVAFKFFNTSGITTDSQWLAFNIIVNGARDKVSFNLNYDRENEVFAKCADLEIIQRHDGMIEYLDAIKDFVKNSSFDASVDFTPGVF